MFSTGCERYDVLSNLLVLEQLKKPQRTAMYISGQKVKMVVEAAALVDNYLLTHRGSSGDPHTYAVAGERENVPAGCVCVFPGVAMEVLTAMKKVIGKNIA